MFAVAASAAGAASVAGVVAAKFVETVVAAFAAAAFAAAADLYCSCHRCSPFPWPSSWLRGLVDSPLAR